ncbi:hypothetical protein [Paraburkholderia adhaesiva]|uniref:hypothetical protein n=1 Tax=Paraburkholderia adhaesiva TaxID=2883244 RepID=UPI001F3E4518|nr:hypothetical protein [Paraburkholderia adhaesiva]
MTFATYELNGTVISEARILAQGELSNLMQGNDVVGWNHNARERWGLFGETGTQASDALVDQRLPVGLRLTAFVGPLGNHFGIVTYQLGTHQHRFLLPMYEPPIQRLFGSLRHDSLVCVLGVCGTEKQFTLADRLPWSGVVPMYSLCQLGSQHSADDVLVELALAAHATSERAAVPPINDIEVHSVHVGIVMPVEYCATHQLADVKHVQL